MAIIRGSHSQSSSEKQSKSDGDSSPPKEPTFRELGNWLQAYSEYTSESESPERFHLWTALSVLSSAVRRNIWLDQGFYMLYPNMFVILVGPPGRVAKSTSIRLGRSLLTAVENIHFGPDSVTREELIRVLGKLSEKGRSAAVTIHSTELSSLIEPSGIKMIQFLTDIYDGDIKWEYATKGQGKDVITKPVVNLLGGTTPSWIAEGLPEGVTEHGFTARVVFVYEDVPRFLNPFPSPPDRELVKSLINDLDHISRLEGSFEWGEGSKDLYSELYTQIDRTIPSDYRIAGFHWRKKIHILKVGMLLSLAESDDLILRVVDLETAWELLTVTEKKMAQTFSAVGKYEHATDLERILQSIVDSGKNGVSATEIYRRNYAVGDVQQIGRILQMLISMGKVRRERIKETSFYFPQ